MHRAPLARWRAGCSVRYDGRGTSWQSTAHGWGKRDEDDLVALAVHAENPVAVLLVEVLDVAVSGLEDTKAQEGPTS
jgi:hypothetical protein